MGSVLKKYTGKSTSDRRAQCSCRQRLRQPIRETIWVIQIKVLTILKETQCFNFLKNVLETRFEL